MAKAGGRRPAQILSADRRCSHKLVFNQWLIGLFGIAPLAEHRQDRRTLRPILVDEGHRGMGGKEELGWLRQRERLAEKGFVFEYSATFKEAVTGAKRPAIRGGVCRNAVFQGA